MSFPFLPPPYNQGSAQSQGRNRALLGATPQDYANALLQLGRQSQPSIRTPGALASNLLANALTRYGQNRGQPAQASAPASSSAITLGSGPNSVQLPSGALPIGQSGPQPGPTNSTFIGSPNSWNGQ